MKQTIVLIATAAALAAGLPSPARSDDASPAPQGGLTRAACRAVRGEVERRLAQQQAKVREQLAVGLRAPALFKLPVRTKCAADPWAGMTALEDHGLGLAAAAKAKGDVLPGMLDRLCEAAGKPTGSARAPQAGRLVSLADHARYMTAVLNAAEKLRGEALPKMPPDARKFMYAWPAVTVKTFGPQLRLTKQTQAVCQNDRAFCGLSQTKCDWPKLVAAAKVLSALAREEHLASLAAACKGAKAVGAKADGVTGGLLFRGECAGGLILIGGPGANTYQPVGPVALLVDVGGDDAYRGKIAAAFDANCGNAVVIDLDGNDVYEGGPLGLATGRLGVGMLIDRRGSDTYRLAPGSGGTGFGGIGILLDADGNDVYVGSRFTQGAAVAGIGLLMDLAGDDRHTSFGFAVGLGAPGGIGAVIDAAGNDSYQCGRKYPSGYNRGDHPNVKPGEAAFQYTSFGLATGLGRRVLSKQAKDHQYSLAGGMGVVIDLGGDDRYDSSNFSQGCGYFFGVGLKLDLAGDDEHGAARYGHAAGAHFGMGLFIDYAGRDAYTSAGPTYNCGCAWDRSAFLFIEGAGDDTYRLGRSSGLGRADINSWAAFVEMGGEDRYVAPSGLGRTSRNALAVFCDLAGNDDYTATGKAGDFHPANKAARHEPTGGVFIDRE
jgi:hypothetical protein